MKLNLVDWFVGASQGNILHIFMSDETRDYVIN